MNGLAVCPTFLEFIVVQYTLGGFMDMKIQLEQYDNLTLGAYRRSIDFRQLVGNAVPTGAVR